MTDTELCAFSIYSISFYHHKTIHEGTVRGGRPDLFLEKGEVFRDVFLKKVTFQLSSEG